MSDHQEHTSSPSMIYIYIAYIALGVIILAILHNALMPEVADTCWRHFLQRYNSPRLTNSCAEHFGQMKPLGQRSLNRYSRQAFSSENLDSSSIRVRGYSSVSMVHKTIYGVLVSQVDTPISLFCPLSII